MGKPTSQVPFVEAHYKGGKQKPTLIVLRSSNTPSVRGAALAIAHMWHQRNSPVDSCHYVVDEATAYNCVPDKVAANPSSFGPKGSLVINVCGEPEDSRLDWSDTSRAAVLKQTAKLVASLVIRYRIPIRYLTKEDEMRWSRWRSRRRGGIVVDVYGDWAWTEFLTEVKQIVERKRQS